MFTIKRRRLMKKLLLCVAVLGLLGCSPHPDGKPSSVSEVCIKGVKYYKSLYKLAPAFGRDSKVILCEK
jgi:hypothetical protein